MKNFNFLIVLLLLSCFSLKAQHGKQKKADRLYEDLAYYKAADVYSELVENDYNTDYNKRRLADTYMKLRSPENAVIYYKDVVEQPDVDPEYYYKYAQALRGAKRYDESREWLKKYLETGADSGPIEKMIEKEDFGKHSEYKLSKAEFNSEVSDFGAFKAGDKVYFVSARADGVADKDKIYSWNGEPFLDVYVLDADGKNASPVAGDINTKLHDGPLTISADGNIMYFTRNNYLNNKEGKRGKDATNNLKIYRATKSGNGWTNVIELPFNSKDYSVGHPALSPDGNTLYFTSNMPGGKGGTDIYKVSITGDNTYGEPENIAAINTQYDESFPFVDEEGVLYFSSNGLPGLGLFDIFSFDTNKTNAEPHNLGEPINSNMDDFAYFQASDNKGYISSNRGGGSDDIYVMNELAPLMLKGKVTDAINHKPVADATVRLFDETHNQIAFLQTDSDGMYSTEVARNKQIPVEAKQIEYEAFTGSVNTSDTDDKTELTYDISLQPVKDVEYLAEINNIYFDFDKYNIRPDAAKELDKLVDLMKNEYPDLVIRIGSHTDKRGTEQYNEELARKRAEATYNYLIDHGIAKDRIVAHEGFGERKPAVECKKCTEEQYQLNRRSMFEVVKME